MVIMADDKKLKSSVDNFLKKDLTYKIRSLKGLVFSFCIQDLEVHCFVKDKI